jgi:hypothetical protein
MRFALPASSFMSVLSPSLISPSSNRCRRSALARLLHPRRSPSPLPPARPSYGSVDPVGQGLPVLPPPGLSACSCLPVTPPPTGTTSPPALAARGPSTSYRRPHHPNANPAGGDLPLRSLGLDLATTWFDSTRERGGGGLLCSDESGIVGGGGGDRRPVKEDGGRRRMRGGASAEELQD